MSIISQEQKIINLENEISFLKDRLYEEQEQNEYLRDKVDKQQKEIEEKNVAINKMSKDISRQLKEIERLEKDNDTLSELVIVNEDKVIKELDLISKDKIREKIKELETLYNCNLDTAMTSLEMFVFVRSYIDKVKNILNELLEDN